ncbi:MAG: proline dehydrogenase family protein [Candidatus Marinimicrobia bacterium]|nr:proline dehydrogenase family protein [Candidatus Neomarinimicrobiota bacterium]
MKLVNNTLATLLPLIPKVFVKRFAMRYVAGETVEEALSVVNRLNEVGYAVTLDILGEHTKSHDSAYQVRDAYFDLYNAIHNRGADCNISLKLTHLGLGFDDDLAENNFSQLLNKAISLNNFLRIDMENSPYTDRTINLYNKYRDETDCIGLVIQSYLLRSADDIDNLSGNRFNVRICKGIYREPEEIAYQAPEEIRQNFISLAQKVIESGGYVGIATHDLFIIDTLETWILNKKISGNRYEFQVLYGVPMAGRLEKLLDAGHKVRIYVPVGEEWYPYSIRRLQENPHLAGYIIKNFFRKK